MNVRIQLRPMQWLGLALLVGGVAGSILGAWYGSQTQRARQLGRRRSDQRPEALNRWEGEGGAVPVSPTHTAAQVTPDSAFAASGNGSSTQPSM